jgi:hypothetical protein
MLSLCYGGSGKRPDLTGCHLVPHALGGPDRPENLVLLCGRCHRDAPDVRDPEYMLRWIADRDHWGVALQRELEKALERAAVTEAQIIHFNELVRQDPNRLDEGMCESFREFAVPVGICF